MKKLTPKSVGIIGLLINALGTLVSVVSITEADGRMTSSVSGITYHMALISGYGFKIGLYLLTLGFTLQIVEKVYEKEKHILWPVVLLAITGSLAIFEWVYKLSDAIFFR